MKHLFFSILFIFCLGTTFANNNIPSYDPARISYDINYQMPQRCYYTPRSSYVKNSILFYFNQYQSEVNFHRYSSSANDFLRQVQLRDSSVTRRQLDEELENTCHQSVHRGTSYYCNSENELKDPSGDTVATYNFTFEGSGLEDHRTFRDYFDLDNEQMNFHLCNIEAHERNKEIKNVDLRCVMSRQPRNPDYHMMIADITSNFNGVETEKNNLALGRLNISSPRDTVRNPISRQLCERSLGTKNPNGFICLHGSLKSYVGGAQSILSYNLGGNDASREACVDSLFSFNSNLYTFCEKTSGGVISEVFAFGTRVREGNRWANTNPRKVNSPRCVDYYNNL